MLWKLLRRIQRSTFCDWIRGLKITLLAVMSPIITSCILKPDIQHPNCTLTTKNVVSVIGLSLQYNVLWLFCSTANYHRLRTDVWHSEFTGIGCISRLNMCWPFNKYRVWYHYWRQRCCYQLTSSSAATYSSLEFKSLHRILCILNIKVSQQTLLFNY